MTLDQAVKLCETRAKEAKEWIKAGGCKGDIGVESFKGNPRITLKKKNVSYQLTWNKAAKLIHQYLHGRNKNESI